MAAGPNNSTKSNMSPRSDTANALYNPSAGNRRNYILLKSGSNPDLLPQERRRTLQTVSELAAEDGLGSSFNASLSVVRETGPTGHAEKGVEMRMVSRNSRRRSLPQTVGTEQSSRTQPSILVTPAESSTLRRSMTTPLDRKEGSLPGTSSQDRYPENGNPNRLSVNFPLRRLSLQDQQLNSVEGRRYSGTREQSDLADPPLQQSVGSFKGKRPVCTGEGLVRTVSHGEGWNARRERERLKRERAVAEAKARREREGRGIVVGSPSTLPSLSPFPVTKPNQAHIRRYSGQQQLLQNSRTVNGTRTPGPLDRKSSIGKTGGPADNDVNAQLLKHASTNSSSHVTAYRDPIYRPQSTASNTTWASPTTGENDPTRTPVRSPPPRSFSSPIPRAQYPPSFNDPSLNSTNLPRNSMARTSSVHSNASGHNSITTVRSQQSGTSHSGKSRRYRHEVTKEHLDALAKLTGSPPPANDQMTAQSLAFLETQQKALESSIDHAGLTSDRATRASLIQERDKSRSRSRGSRASQSRHSSTTERSQTRQSYVRSNGSNIIYDENPDKRGLELPPNESVRLLREREKLLRWKAEREKIEFEKRQRAKISERVRRANELEEEKERELEKQEKKKKNQNGWFCGLFGN